MFCNPENSAKSAAKNQRKPIATENRNGLIKSDSSDRARIKN